MSISNKSKKALVSVTGMQFSQDLEDGEDKIQNVMPGSCQKIGEFYYIKYEEMQEGFTEKTDVLLKAKPGYLEMVKKGLINVTMTIEAGEMHQTNYTTPFGNLLFSVRGKNIAVSADDKGIYVRAKYSMDVNYEYLSENDICIEATYTN
jgi:uncharacterized beta-barrel protein YwiB (DUF1934 family)